MWMPKKSMIGAFVLQQLLAHLVHRGGGEHQRGDRALHRLIELGHDLPGLSTVEMNGISVRSKCRSGNWMSSALPIVSALIPVLSERKNTGMAPAAGRSGSAGAT